MSLINTASTECTPQQEFNFDEMFPIENNDTSDFNFLDMKPRPNPNYINLCKNSLKLYENNLIDNDSIDNDIDDNNITLKRTMSYSDLRINMKKKEEFNLEEKLNKNNLTEEKIYLYLAEEIHEKIFIEEDYKNEEEEIYYDDEEEEEDEELINAILMYNNRNISSDLKKLIRERLKKRIKED